MLTVYKQGGKYMATELFATGLWEFIKCNDNESLLCRYRNNYWKMYSGESCALASCAEEMTAARTIATVVNSAANWGNWASVVSYYLKNDFSGELVDSLNMDKIEYRSECIINKNNKTYNIMILSTKDMSKAFSFSGGCGVLYIICNNIIYTKLNSGELFPVFNARLTTEQLNALEKTEIAQSTISWLEERYISEMVSSVASSHGYAAMGISWDGPDNKLKIVEASSQQTAFFN